MFIDAEAVSVQGDEDSEEEGIEDDGFVQGVQKLNTHNEKLRC